MEEVGTKFREAVLEPKGRLRIDLPTSLARLQIIPALPGSLARFPLLELDIGAGDRYVDPVRKGVDCVLRMGEPGDAHVGCCEAGLDLLQRTGHRIADALKSGRLRELLQAHPPPALPMTVPYPQQNHMPARLRVFIDWLVALTGTQGRGIRLRSRVANRGGADPCPGFLRTTVRRR
jgi:DNA-binding transcriptional LysR family regulator